MSLADVVQEVDVGLLHALRRLADAELLQPLLAGLRAQLTKALGHLLADAKLLAGERPNALGNVLELPGLLAVDACERLSRIRPPRPLLHEQVGDVLLDVRLLSCKRTTLGGEVAVTLRGLLVDVRGRLAQTSLLHAQLTKALARGNLLLREVAVEARGTLAKLRLLRRLLADCLADVGDLARGRLLGSCALGLERAQLTARLHAEACLLRSKLCRLLTQLPLLRTGADGPGSSRLKHLCRLLAKSRTLPGSGNVGLRRGLLHASRLKAKTRLLPRNRGLELPRLSELLRGLLTETRLLGGGLCRLGTELARGLRALKRTLLLLLERRHRLGLRLRVALRKQIGDRARLLLHQAALHLGTLHAFALAAKRARPNGLRRKTLLCNGALALDLPHRLVDDLLTIRIHEGLGTRRVVALRAATDRADALLNSLLCGLEPRLLGGLRRLLCRGQCSANALLEPRLTGRLRTLRRRSVHACDATVKAGLAGRLLGLLRTLEQGTNSLLDCRLSGRRLGHANGLLTSAEALLNRLLCARHLRHGRSAALGGLLQELL